MVNKYVLTYVYLGFVAGKEEAEGRVGTYMFVDVGGCVEVN